MKLRPLAATLLVLAPGGCRPKARPPEPREARADGFRLRYDPALFRACRTSREPRLTDAENGTDIPVGVAPARTRFTLESSAPGRDTAVLELIPLRDPSVPDFGRAYSGLQACARALRDRLDRRDVSSALGSDLPDWDLVDAEQTVHAHVQLLESPWCRGLLYLTHTTQEVGAPVDALELVFQGISRDGAWYVSARFPVGHPSLPPDAPFVDGEAQARAYYLQVQQRLDAAPEGSFTPSLAPLKALLQSLGPDQAAR